MRKVSVSRLKKDFYKLCKELKNKPELVFVVTENNLPVAVVLPWESYRALRENITVLSNPLFAKRAERAAKEIKQGKALTAEELKKKIEKLHPELKNR